MPLTLLLNAGDITITQSTLITLVIAGGSMVFGFIGLLHHNIVGTAKDNKDELKKSIEGIHEDLQPLKTQVAIIENEQEQLKAAIQDNTKWLNHHDTRIQALERHPVLNTIK